MPVEEATIGLLGLITRAVAWLFVEILFYAVCFSIGWVEIKLITLGKYPNASTSKTKVAALGLITVVAVFFGLVIFTS